MTARIAMLVLMLVVPAAAQEPAAQAPAAPPPPPPPSVVAPVMPVVTTAAPAPAAPSVSRPGQAAPVIPAAAAAIPVGSRVGELLSTYESGGRRDPFTSLVTPQRAASNAPGGRARPVHRLAGVALADVQVRGVIRSGDTLLAILEGPNRQSYVGRINDNLLDATVVRIDDDGVIFAEKTERGNAPNHLRKSLRPSGEEFQ